ncbi:MAG: hypothetical protein V1747_09595 [Candidatus Omnitrophota bacterium]
MKNLIIIYICLTITCFTARGFAFSVDYDGDGVPDAVGSSGNVPMPSAPTRVDYPSNSSSNSNRSAAPAQSVPRAPKPPSTEQVISNTITLGIMEMMLNEVFAPTPTGPSPEELQRIEAERLRVEEEKRQQFLRGNNQLTGMLKGASYTTETSGTSQTGELKLKTMPSASDAAHRDFFGQPAAEGASVQLLRNAGPTENDFSEIRQQQNQMDELLAKPQLSSAEQAELNALQAKRNNLWQKAASNQDLTQEERERLQLKMRVATTQLGDHPMVDARALVEKERWTDPYLDVAMAAGKGGATSLGVSGIEEGGKMFLGKAPGFDELLTVGKLGAETPKNTAEKTMAVIDYGLTKAPSWAMLADGAVNSVGAGTRQAIVRYWADKDSSQYYDPTPVQTAKTKWNDWCSNQNDWTRAALNRVGAGEFNK